jgi:hypothetical protein
MTVQVEPWTHRQRGWSEDLSAQSESRLALIELDGDAAVQHGLRYSVSAASERQVYGWSCDPGQGSDWARLQRHTFWDTEIFLLPVRPAPAVVPTSAA